MTALASLAGLVAVFLGGLPACTSSPGPAADLRPDVIVVTVDTLRADRLGFAGHAAARTPSLDALAASGRVFEQATTPLPRTTPALGSLQTGLVPHHHGAREVGQQITAEHTLASRLAEAGWQTAAVSAIGVAGPEQHMDRGFGTFELHHDASAPDITQTAIGLVDAVAADRPMYLWVHFADPHFPYLPHAAGPVQPDAPRCRDLGLRSSTRAFKRDVLFTNRDGLASSVLDECRALYDAEIAAVDEAVGALFAGLDQRRSDRPRFVVFTADHGENQGEGGLFFEHGPDVEDASLRIPLVIAGPGIASARDTGVARLQDIVPTLLDALRLGERDHGEQGSDGLDGVSLLPRLRGGEGGPGLALAESGSALQVPLYGYLVSGRSKRWCLNETRWSWCWLGDRGFGLYDHLADPELKIDRQHEEPDVVRRLTEAAVHWKPEHARQRTARTSTHKLVSTPALDGTRTVRLVSGSDPAVEAELRKELAAFETELDGRATPVTDAEPGTVEALRALGYVE